MASIVFLTFASSAVAAKTVTNTLGGSSGSTGGLFNSPAGIAVNATGAGGVPAGTYYVVDTNNRRIQRFTPENPPEDSFVAAWGWDVNSPNDAGAYEICTVAADCLQADSGFGAGQFRDSGGPQGIAVDQANGNVYVADQIQRRINVFSATGTFQGAFGWGVADGSNAFQFCTAGCVAPNTTAGGEGGKFGTSIGGLAVDGSHNVYVADKNNRRVDVFAPTHSGDVVTGVSFTKAFGWDVETPDGSNAFEVCTVAANCLIGDAGAGAGQFGTASPTSVAVDSSGNVYALDAPNKRVQKFDSTSAIVPAFNASAALSSAFGGNLFGIAYDPSADHLYVSGSIGKATIADTGASTGTLTVEANAGNYKLTFGAQTTANIAFNATAAVVQSSLEALSTIGAGNVTVGGGPGDPAGTTPYTITFTGGPPAGHAVSEITADTTGLTTGLARVAEMDASGAAVADGVHGPDLTIISATLGLAVAPASIGGNIYLASVNGGQRVFVLNTPPTVSLDEVTEVTGSSATLTGEVDPGGGAAVCTLEYSEDGISWTAVPGDPCSSLDPNGGPQPIEAVATGLEEGTFYHLRLTATKPFGAGSASAEETATTLGRPLISAVGADKILDTSAVLRADVNPQLQPTHYHFEYIDEAGYEAGIEAAEGEGKTTLEAEEEGRGFDQATPEPVPDAFAGDGGEPVPVSVALFGLEPSTTYHFRVLATNETGTREGQPATFLTYHSPGTFPSCSNDEFRTGPSAGLPDCRAYEQASPVDKNGGSIQAFAPATRTAADGSTLTFESTTGVPGGTGSQNFPTYMAKRGASGWSTTGLLPTPSSGQRAAVLGWTSDFETVFDRAELFGQGVSMLGRSTAAGAQTTMADYTSPNPVYGYVDTSTDGGTTIFESRPENPANTTQQLTPDAAPGKPNVYAWDHEAGELHLAGVLPDGSTPSSGSRVGAGSSAEEYNRDSGAVLDDGSAFFNANDPEGQLYLRLNPTEESASTVHISKTQKTNGKGPEVPGGGNRDAAGQSPAALAAASSDGTVVTFTSAEKLTNDANTGPEPDPPAIARTNLAEPPCSPAPCEEELDFIPAFANEIAVDETEGYVYWADPEHARIGRAKLDGTGIEENYIALPDIPYEKDPVNEPGVFEPVPARPLSVAVVDEPGVKYIFWTDRGPLNKKSEVQAGLGSVGRVDLDGANLNPTCYKGLTNPRSVAADASHVYWTMPRLASPNKLGDLGRAEVGCSSASKELTLGETWASGDIALNASHIYLSSLSSFSTGIVQRCSKAGTGCTFMVGVSDAELPPGISMDATYLYWSDRKHDRIGRSNLDGSSPDPEFIEGAGRPEDLARGGDHLLWTAFQGAPANPGTDLYQLDRETGVLTDLAPDNTSTNGIEVNTNGTDVLGVLGASEDGSHVYFAANGVPDNLTNGVNQAGESPQLGDCEDGDPFAHVPAKGACNLYLAHGDDVEFIARLDADPPTPEKDSGDSLNWISGRAEIERPELGKGARVSADGKILVFRSSRALTDYDNQGALEFYRFDSEASDLTCLTCSPRGAEAQGPAGIGNVVPPYVTAPQPAATLSRNLSRDGNRFFFETPDALVAADTNGQEGCPPWGSGAQREVVRACQDVYEWEAPGTGSCEEDSPAYSALNGGCIHLISTGKSKEASFFADADLEGENVFIFTYEQLVPQDEDALLDAYDARAGGGFASQQVVPADPCGEGGCGPGPSAPPAVQSPGSAGFAGPSDPAPQRTKPKKHKKRKHAKGKGKKHKAKHGKGRAKQKSRAAKQNGRAGR